MMRNGSSIVHLGEDSQAHRSPFKVPLGETVILTARLPPPNGGMQSASIGSDGRERFQAVLDESWLAWRNRILEEFDVLHGYHRVNTKRREKSIVSSPRRCSVAVPLRSTEFAPAIFADGFEGVQDDSSSATASRVSEVFQDLALYGDVDGHQDEVGEGERSMQIRSLDTEEICRKTVSLERWRKLVSLIMSPKARIALTMTFHVHECWGDYLEMLRLNARNSQTSHAAAKVKIVAGRRTVFTRSEAATSSESALNFKCSEAFIMHPRSFKRILWDVFACSLLFYDSLMLPVNASFDLEDLPVHTIMLWIALVFWILDIPVTFLTGWETYRGVEMRPKRIARLYAKSWLPLDLILAGFDWVLLVFDFAQSRYPMSTLSVSIVRVLRLVRLLRLPKLHIMLRDFVFFTSGQVPVISEMFQLLFEYALYIHFLACAWYAIKKSDPEAWANGCPSRADAYCYFAASHWAMGQLYGATASSYDRTSEWAIAAASLFVGMVLFVLLLSRTHTTISRGAEEVRGFSVLELRQRCIAYAKNHGISINLTSRLLRHVGTRGRFHVGQRLQEEGELLQVLPLFLRSEILHEARRSFIIRVRILSDVEFLSKQLLVQLCSEAITSAISLSGELIFTYGDACSQWRIIESGRLLYVFAQEELWSSIASSFSAAPPHGLGVGLLMRQMQVKHTDSIHSSQRLYESYEHMAKQVKRGASVSEMIMWTPWVHTGDLLATEDCVLLQMNLERFVRVFKIRFEACLLAAKYAQQYVRDMNAITGDISDLQQIQPVWDDVPEEGHNQSKSHVIFLSHYKKEAGTEATLMQEALQLMLMREVVESTQVESAVFLDSEDLTDLGSLKDHVTNSDNLVLLLTPGVLLRPWCILEIVTALKNGVQIVPVEIQRPGIKFAYPDEEWFTQLRKGDLLSKHDLQLLDSEGIAMNDVERAIRDVFTQIALPFSPHRSKNVREAELMDIMKRCTSVTPVAMSSSRTLNLGQRRPSFGASFVDGELCENPTDRQRSCSSEASRDRRRQCSRARGDEPVGALGNLP